jgi:hypothetical protein
VNNEGPDRPTGQGVRIGGHPQSALRVFAVSPVTRVLGLKLIYFVAISPCLVILVNKTTVSDLPQTVLEQLSYGPIKEPFVVQAAPKDMLEDGRTRTHETCCRFAAYRCEECSCLP